VSRLTGWDRRSVIYAYEFGWPEFGPTRCGPIRDTLAELAIGARAARVDDALASVDESQLGEKEKRILDMEKRANEMMDAAQKRLEEVEALANARISDADKAARATMGQAEGEAKRRLAELLSKAKVDAAETMADEANAAKFGRKAAMSAAAIAALMMKDAQGIASALSASPEELKKLPPTTRLRYAETMMQMVATAEKALILSMQAERLRLGEPTEMIGIQTVGDANLAEKELKARVLMKAIERAKKKETPDGQATQQDDPARAVADGSAPVH
jgi:hypothetical protein